jgi:hypothetical protein
MALFLTADPCLIRYRSAQFGKKRRKPLSHLFGKSRRDNALRFSTPKGSRTPVLWLRTRYPRPLDDGGVCELYVNLGLAFAGVKALGGSR